MMNVWILKSILEIFLERNIQQSKMQDFLPFVPTLFCNWVSEINPKTQKFGYLGQYYRH